MQGFVAILLSAIAALPHTSSGFGSVGLFEVVSTFVHDMPSHPNSPHLDGVDIPYQQLLAHYSVRVRD